VNRRWRVGRHLGRTIYEMVGEAPSDEDIFIGIMETKELALLVISAHNYAVKRWD
jgi:hypothetical protein